MEQKEGTGKRNLRQTHHKNYANMSYNSDEDELSQGEEFLRNNIVCSASVKKFGKEMNSRLQQAILPT